MAAELSGTEAAKLVARAAGHKAEAEVRLLVAALQGLLVDKRDYHMTDRAKFAGVPKEKLLALLREATSTTTLDLEIEVEAVSKKVIQVDASLTVNDFIMNPTDEKIKPLFREVSSLEGAFWLFVSVKGTAQEMALLHHSR